MPTSTELFAKVAAKHGSVDPTDVEAVRHWYEETMPTLPKRRVDEILEDLLQSEGSHTRDTLPRQYPKGISLPRLDDARHAPLPLLFIGSLVFVKDLLARLRPGGKKRERRG